MTESDLDRVRRVARLARLELGEEQARALAPQFARILEAFQSLSEVPVGNPAAHRALDPGEAGLRADEPLPSLAPEVLLENAPEALDGHYGVPKTVGGVG